MLIWHDAYIGLGSNLDLPVDQLHQALKHLDALPLTQRVATSPFYGSRPVGPQDQPDFVNACVRLKTALSPLALLDQLQSIEQRQQRVRIRHWGPRTLDLDLLLYDDKVMQHPRLNLPHHEMHRRSFVLIPLLDIAPGLSHPTLGCPLQKLVTDELRGTLTRL